MTAGEEYLPPLVQKLRADASDFIAGYAEAEAAQKAFGKTSTSMGTDVTASMRKSGTAVSEFDELVISKMRKGETAIAAMKRELTQAEDHVRTLRKEMAKGGGNFAVLNTAIADLERLKRLAKEVAPDFATAGSEAGEKFGANFAGGLGSLSSMIIPVLVGFVVLASPAIAAAIGSAVAVGLGLGFVGVGIMLAAMLSKPVQTAGAKLGEQIKKQLTYAISGAFDDSLLAAIREFSKYLPTLGLQLRAVLDAVAPLLKPLADSLGKTISGFLLTAKDALANSQPAIEAFLADLPDIAIAVGDFLGAITKNGPALVRFIDDATTALTSFLDGTGKTVAWLEGAYLWLAKLHDKAIAGGWDTPWAAVATGAKKAWDWIKKAAAGVGSWAAGVWAAVTVWVSGVYTSVKAWFGRTLAAVGAWVAGVVAWFRALPGRVMAFIHTIPSIMADALRQLLYDAGYYLGRLFLYWSSLPGKIVAVVVGMWAWITLKWDEGIAATIARMRAFPGQVVAYFAGMWSMVSGWVVRLWSSVTSWFRRTKDDAVAWIEKAYHGVVGWFSRLPAAAVAKTKELKDKIVAFFKGAPGWLYQAGKDIISGLVKGISDVLSWAVDKAKSAAKKIAEGFKDALGIHSPSVVFAGFGTNTIAGYVQGLTKAMPTVWSTWRQMMAGGPQLAYVGGPTVSPTMAAGIVRPAAGTTGAGPMYVETTVQVDGKTIVKATTPAAQRRKGRSGKTGLS